MRRMILAGLVAVVACAPQARTTRPVRQVGDYAFRFDVASQRFSGTFSVRADSIVVESHDCESDAIDRDATKPARSFLCRTSPGAEPVFVTFDAFKPMSAYWYAPRNKETNGRVRVERVAALPH